MAGHPRPVRDQGVQRRGGGDPGAQGLLASPSRASTSGGGRELAEQGVGERQLAEVCSGGRGRPATRTELDAALDALSGPDGLTGQASTFTRTDVVDALAKRLPVAPSARSRRSPRPRRRPTGSSTSGPSGSPTTGAWAWTGSRRRSCWPLSGNWSTAPPAGPTRAAPSSGPRWSARSWTATPPPGRTRRPWSATSPRAAPGWRWWSGGPAVGQDLGAGAGPGGVRAGRLPGPRHRPDRDRHRRAGRRRLHRRPHGRPAAARPPGVAGRSWTAGRCWWWTRRPWSPPASSPPCSSHAERAGAKVVLVGDDRQFASIAAGGGFRALRLRLGASRADRQPPAGRGLGAAGDRRRARRQPGAGDRRLCRA